MPTIGRKQVQLRRLHHYKGLYIEDFPDTLAGAPISNACIPPPNLDTYMCACGPMADLEYFEVAELLMMTGLTNADKDQHLKSKMVSTLFNTTSGEMAE
jgi:hypothetical protein